MPIFFHQYGLGTGAASTIHLAEKCKSRRRRETRCSPIERIHPAQEGTTRRRWNVLDQVLTTYVKMEAYSLVRERPASIQFLVGSDCNTEPVTVFSCKG